MSTRHPIISVTGSSGAGTTSVRATFEQIFRREHITPAFIQGDAFHKFDRAGMKRRAREAEAAGDHHFSHFGHEANLLEDLEQTFATYAATGQGRSRNYIHDAAEAERYGAPIGSFTDWEDLPSPTDLLFYEGLHGAVIADGVDTARFADLKIGVVPVINLEWIQKIHRDRSERGYSAADVTETILRRMPDYVKYICPQYTATDINFQRIPTVDTSNPFIARAIPTADESMVVIRFRDPHGIDFPYLLSMVPNSFMSRANSIVIPGGKLDLAMQLILTPMILSLVEKRRRALAGG
ncbi:phosphoribulokinase [Methylopila turkensis]|uniref:phosphoribulokinase n=1 Tax=Methylopila turkensis TaxID=1437816 RepID=A0A9W6JST5_9HYPH|nr:phosphoribulokinase [Methylopila turkensis]GLK80948.1 phosphoribulokinase [Methylopila turkensis]